jgi:hypothetical protein
MTAYVTQNYDFHDAIRVSPDIHLGKYEDLVIYKVDAITDSQSLVRTSEGTFVCESFEDKDATVYMKVYPFIGPL